MISHLLALLLAMRSPAVAASASPAVAPASPASSPAPALAPGDVEIVNSGSTNTAGFRIDVHPDATVDVHQFGETVRKSVDRAQVDELMAKVKAGAPFSEPASAHCMRSVSFGTTTKVTYDGRTTGDIGCGAGPAGQDLSRTVHAIETQLGLNTFNALRRRPL
ncbi:MAG: hypothetical protein IAI49_02725 [Candidatus Eremiobacteraeota bacterium]|nr:hypothetical protein [Candidatus Eremiobacteraeota bacterium]